ncbi:EAL domain-containing protein [Rhizobium sp. VS19-DR104.2]|uniref:putative bifunctional diguanylate cyclase/phosphodiesterase n=1 Tax=unclassified Rhizobium TaxID=2613769 RepID=UPI001CC5C521|nr:MULTISPECIES: EAL domain-containing protein [unclassified Rhizobium]MBZ5761999.1 EAL domain-containing protein [Rhizobium sp. VS19-DR96]MBZ5768355.1 EAL domain-containing protein [Rhizobium sp. VS19-DR129.2]MBZ5775625.1 EAL domain-containing protein [Rhizobium sp. VS19-DRK62.2]MBZ5786877.1 EAL domain-containing protein [Rhizobium sp. VS19-DR121]MBZ5804447.1 EAL domain-containing protein [Rhizobium sp. VS19-DR181]
MLSHMRLFRWLTLREEQPELAIAQCRELQGQIPLLYALLSLNAVAVAYTHLDVAPAWMTVWIPLILVSASILRLIAWLKKPDAPINGAEAIQTLRRTTVLGGVMASVYISWSLGLGSYGGDHQQAHVAIFIAITVIGCIFCLIHLPQAALAVTAIVTIPYLIYYFSLGDAVYIAIALNILLVTIVMIRVLLNSHRGFVRLVRSEAETQRLNREVTVLAHTDPLTRLPNRRLFFSELSGRIGLDGKKGGRICVGIIDLDRFKAVNDTYGHIVGDQLLEAAGERLRVAFGSEAMVARLGGDEFAFLLEMDGEAATAFANQTCAALLRPFKLGDIAISIGASCGLSTSTSEVVSAMTLYDRADYALYRAKSERRGFAVLYSSEHEQLIRSERAVEAALQAADLETEMEINLQPIVSGPNFEMRAVEALARWTSPTLGRIPPDIFIPLAERAGIIHRLTLTLLRKALAQFTRLPAGITLSFNLSAHDLTSSETVVGIIALILEAGTEPSRITMELTETAVMRDFDAAEQSIRLLRGLGIKIALDDFGTGQSSLSYLHRLPIDKVKIDRSFVIGTASESGCEILAAVVALCRSMKMQCIAEGVEDTRQLDILRGIGCDTFQGYLFARPMAIDSLMEWMTLRVAA